MEKGKFIISLDFELHWGGAEKWELKEKKFCFSNTIKNIPEVLDLFEKNKIRATWATVGFLFSKNKDQLKKFSPNLKPTYIQTDLSYYRLIENIGINEEVAPYHYAPSLIKRIIQTPGQELASHTFSHYYCNEKGQTIEQFDEDLKAAQSISKENFGIELKSLVFPRNQINKDYLSIAKKNGIKVIRSNPDIWFWNKNYGKITPLFRAIDTLFSIGKHLSFSEYKKEEQLVFLPSSRFFRPYISREKFLQNMKITRIKREMTYAAKNNENYHLWWHPHNFGYELEENFSQLKAIILHFNELKMKYNFSSSNMEDFEI